jgi:hypothetical protein
MADEKLDEAERGKAEEAAKAVNLFESAGVLEGTDKVYTVSIPELGGYVTFRKLTWTEAKALNNIPNLEDRAIRMVARMIEKANPGIKDIQAKLEAMPFDAVALISQRVTEKSVGFLRPKP